MSSTESSGPKTDSLFREKALRRRMNPWLGGVNLVQPPAPAVLAWMFAAGAIGVVAFVLSVAFSARVKVSGAIVPASGLISVASPVSGVVTHAPLAEGEMVRRSQVLAQISSALTYDGGDVASASVDSISLIKSEIEKTASMAREKYISDLQISERKLSSLRSDRNLLMGDIQRAQRQVELAADSMERLQKLKAERMVSMIDANKYENDLLQKTSDLDAARRRLADLDRSISETVRDRVSIETNFRSGSSDLNVRILELSGSEAANRASKLADVTSPGAGQIATVLVKEGQAIKQGDEIATLVPNGSPLRVELLVSSRAIGYVKVGDVLKIEYDAFPYQKFGRHRGTIERVSLAPIPGQAADDYRVVVVLDSTEFKVGGQTYNLRPGMIAHSYIALEEQSLIARVAAPFIDIFESIR